MGTFKGSSICNQLVDMFKQQPIDILGFKTSSFVVFHGLRFYRSNIQTVNTCLDADIFGGPKIFVLIMTNWYRPVINSYQALSETYDMCVVVVIQPNRPLRRLLRQRLKPRNLVQLAWRCVWLLLHLCWALSLLTWDLKKVQPISAHRNDEGNRNEKQTDVGQTLNDTWNERFCDVLFFQRLTDLHGIAYVPVEQWQRDNSDSVCETIMYVTLLRFSDVTSLVFLGTHISSSVEGARKRKWTAKHRRLLRRTFWHMSMRKGCSRHRPSHVFISKLRIH